MAATVANLTLVATKMGLMGEANQRIAFFYGAYYQGFITVITTLVLRLSVVTALRSLRSTENMWAVQGGFRPDF